MLASSFENDLGDDHSYQQLSKIILYMAFGRQLIIKGHNHICARPCHPEIHTTPGAHRSACIRSRRWRALRQCRTRLELSPRSFRVCVLRCESRRRRAQPELFCQADPWGRRATQLPRCPRRPAQPAVPRAHRLPLHSARGAGGHREHEGAPAQPLREAAPRLPRRHQARVDLLAGARSRRSCKADASLLAGRCWTTMDR